MNQRTLSIIKPDAVKRNYTDQIIKILTDSNLKIINRKDYVLSLDEAKKFYEIHKERPFFNDLVSFMSSGPIVVLELEGEDAVVRYRNIMGATNPKDAEEGTLRKLFGASIDENAVHGSDSLENAQIEIKFFFPDE